MRSQEYFYNGQLFLDRLKTVTGLNTQKDLAAALGVYQGTVSKWKNTPPAGETLVKIAALYHCSIDFLLGIQSPAAPAYPDFLLCVDALAAGGLISFETLDDRIALAVKNDALSASLSEYAELKNALKRVDSSSAADMIKRLWFEKELKKDCALSAAGMRKLSALRDFAE